MIGLYLAEKNDRIMLWGFGACLARNVIKVNMGSAFCYMSLINVLYIEANLNEAGIFIYYGDGMNSPRHSLFQIQIHWNNVQKCKEINFHTISFWKFIGNLSGKLEICVNKHMSIIVPATWRVQVLGRRMLKHTFCPSHSRPNFFPLSTERGGPPYLHKKKSCITHLIG